jgi:hypothetical protein
MFAVFVFRPAQFCWCEKIVIKHGARTPTQTADFTHADDVCGITDYRYRFTSCTVSLLYFMEV